MAERALVDALAPDEMDTIYDTVARLSKLSH